MAGIENISKFTSTAHLSNSNVTKEAICCINGHHHNNNNKNNNNTNDSTNCLCIKQLNALKTNNYKAREQQQQIQQRPLTLCLVVMMALTLTMMPHYANAAAIRRDMNKDASSSASAETAVERELLLLTSAEHLIEEAMKDAISIKLASKARAASASASSTSSSSSPASSKSLSLDVSSSADDDSSLDVLRHVAESMRADEQQKDRRSTLRKRHLNDLHNLRIFDSSSHQIEWHNPCTVSGENQNINELEHIPRRAYHYLNKFKDDIRKEYVTRKLGLKHINTDDMESWRLYRDYYTFLPKLKQKSKISLSRWYRNMQMYVASFSYLGRTQFNWDMKKQRFVGETTKELDQLLSSARLILCELETAINGSHPRRNAIMLKTFSRSEMEERLDFQTKEQERNGVPIIEPTILDLKFAKHSYLKYLATMRKIIKNRLQGNKNREIPVESAENGSSSETYNNNVIDDNNNNNSDSINISEVMRSDSYMTSGESFEMYMRANNQQKPIHHRHNRKSHRNNASRKSAELPEN